MKRLIFLLLIFNSAFAQIKPVYNGYAQNCPTNNTNRWKLNDGSGSTAVDVCGGVNATTVNSPSWGADYLTLASASSQYVNTNNSTDFDFGTTDFSVSFWIKTSTTDRGVGGNFQDQGGATYRGWGIYIYPNSGGSFNGIEVFVYGANGNSDVTWGSNSAIANGAWHNVAIVFTRSLSGSSTTIAQALYIDGSPISQGGTGTGGSPAATTTGDISTTGNLMFGTIPFYVPLNIFFNGDIGDYRIYNTPISSGTANKIFVAGRNGNYQQ